MPGERPWFDGGDCPECGGPTLTDTAETERWCAFNGSVRAGGPSCWWSSLMPPEEAMDAPLTPEEEARAKASMRRIGDKLMGEPCPAGHPAACLDAAGACRWCAEVAEARLRLAIWSGEGVPEGWTAAADGVPSIERDLGDLTAEVYADGRWLIWRDLRDDLAPGVVVEDHPGPRETTEALRAAEAWLRLLAGVPDGR